MLPRRKREAHALIHRGALRPICGALGLLALLATSVLAAPNPPMSVEQRVLVMRMAGHRVTAPMPDWTSLTSGMPPLSQVQAISSRVGPNAESVLLYRTDETPVVWTHIEGVLAVGKPGYTTNMQIGSIILPLKTNCTANQLRLVKMPPITKGNPDAYLMLCGSYKPTGTGPRNCGGGIILAVAVQSPFGAVRTYNEWCTARFDAATASTWPLTQAYLTGIAGSLQSMTSFTVLPPSDYGAPRPHEGSGVRQPGG